MFSHRSTSLGALGLTAALFLASCGSTDSGATTAQAGSDAQSSSAGANDASAANDASVPSDFPDVDVLDVRTGETVNLTSLAPRDKPALLWFYAPH